MRALSSGELRAVRDNSGNWQITPEAVDDWRSMRRSPDRQSPDMPVGPPPVTVMDTPETLARVAALQAENEGLRDRLADTQADRDRLASMLEKSLEARTFHPPTASFWARLLGRS